MDVLRIGKGQLAKFVNLRPSIIVNIVLVQVFVEFFQDAPRIIHPIKYNIDKESMSI